jgi:hypothetical protein
MFSTATRTERDRRVSYAFDGPVIDDPAYKDELEEWHVRYKITFSHNKTSKRFEADVWKAAAATRNGYTMERFEIFSGSSGVIAVQSAARFSQSAFDKFIAYAMEVAIDTANNPDNVSRTAELLREAQSLAAVAS